MSDLIYQFSQQAHPGYLTNLGRGIAQIGNATKARKAEEARLAQYGDLLNQFQQTNDPTLLVQMQNIAPEKFEGFQKAYDMMDEQQRKSMVQSNMETLGFLNSNDTDNAAQTLALRGKAYRNAGDMEEAEKFQEMSRMVLNGEGDKVKTMLTYLTGAAPEGKEALESMWKMGQEARAENEFALDVLKAGQQQEWDAKTLEAARVAANEDPKYGEVITSALNYARLLQDGYKLDPNEFNKAITGLRGEWMKYTDGYQRANENFDKVISALDAALTGTDVESKGISDLAGLTAFQRMIDDATVRQDDVNNIRGANAFLSQLDLLIKHVEGGDLLSDEQRKEMKRLSKEYLAAQKKYVDEYAFPPLQAAHTRLDPEGGTYTEVFGKYNAPEEPPENTFWNTGARVAAPAPAADSSGARIPTAADSDAYKAWLKTMDPGAAASIDTMSVDALRRKYKTITERDWDTGKAKANSTGVVTTGDDGERVWSPK